MKRSTKKQNYRLFVKLFSEELTKQTNNTLKNGFASLITKDAAKRYAINRPEFWRRSMRQHVKELIPLIKQECFKEPDLKELLLSRMNDKHTHTIMRHPTKSNDKLRDNTVLDSDPNEIPEWMTQAVSESFNTVDNNNQL